MRLRTDRFDLLLHVDLHHGSIRVLKEDVASFGFSHNPKAIGN